MSINKNIIVKIKITIENKKLSFNPFFEEASIELNFPLYTYLEINNTDKIIKIYQQKIQLKQKTIIQALV